MNYDTDALSQEVKWSGKQPRRSFGGILMYSELKEMLKEKYPEADEDEMHVRLKLERNFQNAHLRAYLKGAQKFVFGRDFKNKPLYFDVEEIWE